MAVFSAIAAVITGIGTWFAGLGIVGQFLVRVGVGLALNGIASAIARKKQGEVKSPGVTFQLQQGADQPRSFIMGSGATAGSLVYHNTWGSAGNTPNAYYTRVTALSDLPVTGLHEVWVDGQRCVLDTENPDEEKGFPVVNYRTNSSGDVLDVDGDWASVSGTTDHLWVKFYDGNQTAADSFLVDTVSTDQRPWSSTEVGVGVAYVIITCRFNQELFQGGPRLMYVLDGIPLSDPSTGQVGTGDNLPALQAYQLLKGLSFQGQWLYGLQGVEAARFDEADWIAQIEKCRSPVPGGDAMTDGQKEDAFGSTTVPEQYRSGGEISVDIELGNALEAVLAGCNGRLVDTGWKYRLLIGPPATSAATISDGDILSTEEQTFTPFFGLADTTNGITAVYPEPDEEWQNQAAPPLYVPEYEAEDGNRRLLDQADMPMVPYREQVQRLMSAALAEARRARRHTIALGPKYWALEPGDIITWSSDRNGYDAKLFRVDGLYDLPTADIVLDITEVDPEDYDWSAATDYTSVTTGTISPQPLPIQPFAGFQVLPHSVTDGFGINRRPAIMLRWDREVDQVSGVRYQVRVAATSKAVSDGQTAAFQAGGFILTEGLSPNVAYQVRAIYLTPNGRPVEWSNWLSVTTPDVRVGPADLATTIMDQITDAQAAADQAADDAAAAHEAADDVQESLDAAVASLTVDYNATQQAATNAQTARDEAEAARNTAATHAATADGARGLAQTAQSAAEAARDLANSAAAGAATSATESEASNVSASVARDAAVGVMADLGQADFSTGGASWTSQGTVSSVSKAPVPDASILSGDPDFATYYAPTPGANTIVGPIRHYAIDPNKVYRLKVVAKILSNGTGTDASSRFGASTFNADGTLANSNVQFQLPRHDVAEGVYEEEVLASMRPSQAGDGIDLHINASSADRGWFHYRFNDGNYTDATFALSSFEVEDVTSAYDAGLSASAAATSESQASAFKDDAQAASSASSAAQVAAEAARDSSQTSAASSASSASSAAASETAAGQSASAAQSSATGAATDASNASTSASDAATSASDAAGSSSTAASQASAAASSANNAGDSASASAASAQAAATSATGAGQSASAADSDRIAAQTARGGAEAAQTASVAAQQSAEGHSSAAATSATLSASSAQVAADTVAAIGPSTFDAPLEAWNYNANHVNSSPQSKPKISTGDIVSDDPDFGTCYQFPSNGNRTVGPARLYPWDSGKVYAATVQFKTELDGTGVSNNQFGVSLYEGNSWNGSVDNVQRGVGDISVADGVQTATVWFTEREDLAAIALSETGFAVVSITANTSSNGALFHIRQNASDAGTVVQRVNFFEVRDVTEVADALLAQEAAGGSASAASTSASSAAASETAAGQSASAAQTARTGAETARGGAEAAQTAAATSATEAGQSASSASTSADIAAASETAAGQSASAASSSASSASSSASDAAQSAGSASSSANSASTSAGSASSSQTSAAQSATSASNSANAAAQSATVAATALSDFQLSSTDFQLILNDTTSPSGAGSVETIENGPAALGQAGTIVSATGSGVIDTAGVTNGTYIEIPMEQALQFQSRRVRVDILARADATNPAASFVSAYSTADNGNSGRKTFALSSGWAWHSFYYDVPLAVNGGSDWIGLFGDAAQSGKKTQFARVIVRLASLAGDIPEISAIQAQVTTNQTAVATAVSALTSAQTAQESIIGSLSATVSQQGATLATVDGVVQAMTGLTATTETEDGVTYVSGFKATTFQNPDGTGAATLELLGEVVAEGSIATNRLISGLGKNLVKNSDFAQGHDRFWFGPSGPAGGVRDETIFLLRPAGQTHAGATFPTFEMAQQGASVSGYADAITYNNDKNGGASPMAIPCNPGEWFVGSAYFAALGCTADILLVFRNSSGGFVGQSRANVAQNSASSSNPDAWPRHWVKGAAPAGAAFVQLYIRKYGTTSGSSSNLLFHKPMVELSHSAAGGPSPWSPPGTTLIDGGQMFTNSITAQDAVFATGAIQEADIGDLQVSTLKIKDQAVTVPVRSQSLTLHPLTSSGNWIDIMTLVIDREGYSTEIMAGGDYHSITAGTPTGICGLRFLRNGTVIAPETAMVTGPSGSRTTWSMKRIDGNLGTGPTTYKLQAEKRTDGSNTANTEIIYPWMTLHQFKK